MQLLSSCRCCIQLLLQQIIQKANLQQKYC